MHGPMTGRYAREDSGIGPSDGGAASEDRAFKSREIAYGASAQSVQKSSVVTCTSADSPKSLVYVCQPSPGATIVEVAPTARAIESARSSDALIFDSATRYGSDVAGSSVFIFLSVVFRSERRTKYGNKAKAPSPKDRTQKGHALTRSKFASFGRRSAAYIAGQIPMTLNR